MRFEVFESILNATPNRGSAYLDAGIISNIIKFPNWGLGKRVTEQILRREVDERLPELPMHLLGRMLSKLNSMTDHNKADRKMHAS